MLRRSYMLIVIALWPGSLASQALAERVSAREHGTVRLSFAARPGTCGNGSSGINLSAGNEEWQPDCGPRLVRVALRLSNHRVYSLRSYVGGRWLPDTTAWDLGTVGTRDAATYFMSLAERDSGESLTGDPLLPVILADSVVTWPGLLRLARNDRLPREIRRHAVFWLGQVADAAAGHALDSIIGDMDAGHDVRKHAVFAISQRPNDEGVPALIRIARTSPSPDLRKTALFWLGQTDDPRALDLFEEILR